MVWDSLVPTPSFGHPTPFFFLLCRHNVVKDQRASAVQQQGGSVGYTTGCIGDLGSIPSFGDSTPPSSKMCGNICLCCFPVNFGTLLTWTECTLSWSNRSLWHTRLGFNSYLREPKMSLRFYSPSLWFLWLYYTFAIQY